MSPAIRIVLGLALILAAVTSVRVPAASADGDVTVAAQDWWQTAPEAKFREFREWPRAAWVESFLARGRIGSVATSAWGEQLFLNEQAMGASLNKGIRWQLDGSYRQVPHLFSLIARSPYTDMGQGTFALSDSLQRQNQSDPGNYIPRMNSVLAVAPVFPLEHRTDVIDGRLRFRPSPGWQLGLRGERRSRGGTKAYSMSFGFSNSNEIAEQIDQRMTDVAATADYSRRDMGVRVLLGVSAFDNRVDTFISDNPRRVTDSPTAGSSRGRIDLYPNNHAVRGQFDLNWRFSPKSLLTGTIALASLHQDDPWQPFTINSAIPQASLDSLYGNITARSTNAEALRLTQNYRFSKRFGSNVRGAIRFRQHHFSNNTEEYPFRGVVQYDQTLVRDTVGFHNHPFGNQQITVGTDWDARLGGGLDLTAAYDHRWREHTFREIENDQEDEVRARIGNNPMSTVRASLTGTYGIRRADEFNDDDYQRPDQPDTLFIENPLLRRYDVADRDRLAGLLEIGWTPTDLLDLSLNGDYRYDDYVESTLGLSDDERWMVLGQATLTPGTAWELTGGYGFGRTDTDQQSQERTAAGAIPIRVGNLTAGTDWSARIRDRNDYGFVMATWNAIPRTFALTSGYWVSRDQTKYFLDNETGTAGDLPDTYYLRQEGRLEGRWRLTDGTQIIARYGYDTWKVNDFAAKDIPLLGVASTPPAATAIYLGAGYQNYTTHTVGFAVSRSF